MKTRRMRVAASSRRLVVLVLADLLSQLRKKKIQTTGKKDLQNQSIEDLRALKVFLQVKDGEVPGHATFRRPYADETCNPSVDSRLIG